MVAWLAVAGQVPDVDAVLGLQDTPCIAAGNGSEVMPPAFSFTGTNWATDIPFPDFTYWGHEVGLGLEDDQVGGCGGLKCQDGQRGSRGHLWLQDHHYFAGLCGSGLAAGGHAKDLSCLSSCRPPHTPPSSPRRRRPLEFSSGIKGCAARRADGSSAGMASWRTTRASGRSLCMTGSLAWLGAAARVIGATAPGNDSLYCLTAAVCGMFCSSDLSSSSVGSCHIAFFGGLGELPPDSCPIECSMS